MKFLLLSDLHGKIDFTHLFNQDYSDTVLILPGDVHEAKKINKYREIINSLSPLFSQIISVPGNHEYYGSNFNKITRNLKIIENEIHNYSVLNSTKHMVLFDEKGSILVLGDTIWTDFDNNNPVVKLQAQLGMNDYKKIRFGNGSEYWKYKLSTDYVSSLYHNQIINIQKTIDLYKSREPDIRIVMISHHAPSTLSSDPKYTNDVLKYAYCNNLENFMINNKITTWCHGHVHNTCDYYIDKTRVLCNPRGYGKLFEENSNFDPNFWFYL